MFFHRHNRWGENQTINLTRPWKDCSNVCVTFKWKKKSCIIKCVFYVEKTSAASITDKRDLGCFCRWQQFRCICMEKWHLMTFKMSSCKWLHGVLSAYTGKTVFPPTIVMQVIHFFFKTIIYLFNLFLQLLLVVELFKLCCCLMV